MNYIPTNTPIRLEWTVKKGIGNVVEDFSRSEVFLFIETDRDRWAVQCEKTSLGLITAELPNNMAEGVYHVELIWYKGEDALRSIQRTKKECVFAIDENVEHKGNKCVVRIESIASPYGYDGLSAYELAVIGGYTSGMTQNEWSRILYGYQESEANRIVAENTREQNEADRQDNENTRMANEAERESMESMRMEAEQAREQNEADRQDNENTRMANEAERESMESMRMEAEQARESNEDTRQANEAIRQKQEGAKNSKDNESRWGIFNNAEEERAKTFSDKEEERAGTARATESQREAVFVANEGKDSSTDSKSRWGRFNNAEGIRETNETTRKANETTRESNEVTRKANEATRQSKETERIANETARQSKETERIANEAIRQNEFYAFANRVFDGGRADTQFGGARVLNCGGADAE
jgi:hypothetical protein